MVLRFQKENKEFLWLVLRPSSCCESMDHAVSHVSRLRRSLPLATSGIDNQLVFLFWGGRVGHEQTIPLCWCWGVQWWQRARAWVSELNYEHCRGPICNLLHAPPWFLHTEPALKTNLRGDRNQVNWNTRWTPSLSLPVLRNKVGNSLPIPFLFLPELWPSCAIVLTSCVFCHGHQKMYSPTAKCPDYFHRSSSIMHHSLSSEVSYHANRNGRRRIRPLCNLS